MILKIPILESIGSIDAMPRSYVSLRLNAGNDKANRDEVPAQMCSCDGGPLSDGPGAKDLKLEKVVIGSGPPQS